MTNPTPYSTAPIILPLPLETAPAPVGDLTTVTDCNVYLRRHPAGHQ
ncbi:hypothetical protein [Streptomyces chrestomyceticus]